MGPACKFPLQADPDWPFPVFNYTVGALCNFQFLLVHDLYFDCAVLQLLELDTMALGQGRFYGDDYLAGHITVPQSISGKIVRKGRPCIIQQSRRSSKVANSKFISLGLSDAVT